MHTSRGEDLVDGVPQIHRSTVGERERNVTLGSDAVREEVERLVFQGLPVRVTDRDLTRYGAHHTRLVHPFVEVGNELEHVAAQLGRRPVPADHAEPSPPHYLLDQPRNGVPGLRDGMTAPPCSSHDLGGGVTAPGGTGRPLMRGMTTDSSGR